MGFVTSYFFPKADLRVDPLVNAARLVLETAEDMLLSYVLPLFLYWTDPFFSHIEL